MVAGDDSDKTKIGVGVGSSSMICVSFLIISIAAVVVPILRIAEVVFEADRGTINGVVAVETRDVDNDEIVVVKVVFIFSIDLSVIEAFFSSALCCSSIELICVSGLPCVRDGVVPDDVCFEVVSGSLNEP